MSRSSDPLLPEPARRLLAAGSSTIPGMVPGATRRNVLVGLAYLLVWLLGVGVAGDLATGPLNLTGTEPTL